MLVVSTYEMVVGNYPSIVPFIKEELLSKVNFATLINLGKVNRKIPLWGFYKMRSNIVF